MNNHNTKKIGMKYMQINVRINTAREIYKNLLH